MAKSVERIAKLKAGRHISLYATVNSPELPPVEIEEGVAIVDAKDGMARISSLYVPFSGKVSELEIGEPGFVVNDYHQSLERWNENFNNRNLADQIRGRAASDGHLRIPVSYLQTDAQKLLADRVMGSLEKNLERWVSDMERTDPFKVTGKDFKLLPDNIKYSPAPILHKIISGSWTREEKYERPAIRTIHGGLTGL